MTVLTIEHAIDMKRVARPREGMARLGSEESARRLKFALPPDEVL